MKLMLLLLFMLGLACSRQRPPRHFQIVEKVFNNHNYIDFVYSHTLLWALTDSGQITCINPSTGDTLPPPSPTTSPILALAKDWNENLIVGTRDRRLWQYDEVNRLWKPLGRSPAAITGIAFNSKNKGFLITEKGIVDIKTGVIYFLQASPIRNAIFSNSWHRTPHYLMDSRDNLWIGFGFGEWGGDLIIFDTRNKEFIQPTAVDSQFSIEPVQSIFEGPKHIYVTTGLSHFVSSGGILQFDQYQSRDLFISYPSDTGSTLDAEYIWSRHIQPKGRRFVFLFPTRLLPRKSAKRLIQNKQLDAGFSPSPAMDSRSARCIRVSHGRL